METNPEAISILMLILYFLIGIIGVIVHFLKKKVKGQSIASVKKYFATHFRSTVLMFFAYIGAFAGLHELGQLTMAAAFMAGYTCDSLINKNEMDVK